MTREPFERLWPAANARHARWVVESLEVPPEGGVSFRVPADFESIVRIQHRLADGRSWSEAVPDLSVLPSEQLPYPFPDPLLDVTGELGEAIVDLLVPVLATATSTPETTHFAQWDGWGDLHRGSSTTMYFWEADGPTADELEERRRLQEQQELAAASVYRFVERCPRQEWWGGRTMFLFDGAIDDVASIGSPPFLAHTVVQRRCPQWWWPDDRSWFVATEIDDPCSYVGGSLELIEQVELLDLETRRVVHSDRW